MEHGYTGTEEQWLASLVGAKGEKGDKGDKGDKGADGGGGGSGEKGAKGDTGAAGKSAYDLAVQQGFGGTLDEWLASLKGADGAAGQAGAAGAAGAAGRDGRDGKDGKSAYDLAVERGYEGTLDEWLSSLSSGGLSQDIYTGENEDGSRFIWVNGSEGTSDGGGSGVTDRTTVQSAVKGVYVDANNDVVMVTDNEELIVVGHVDEEAAETSDGKLKIREMDGRDRQARTTARAGLLVSVISFFSNAGELVWTLYKKKKMLLG